MSRFAPFYDPADMTACFPAEASVADINARVVEHGLFFPLWLEESKSPLAHIRAGSHLPASHRFGALADNILGLNFRTARGISVRLGNRTIKNCTGFDLAHFVLNSRHPLGEVTDVILRLRALPGPLRWFGCQLSPDRIEQFRRELGRSPWWHIFEAVEVTVRKESLTLWIGLRGKEEIQIAAREWLNSAIPSSLPIEETELNGMALDCDATVKLLPSEGVEQAWRLVESFGGHARLHLTNGFFRWSSPNAAQATGELAALRNRCIENGGHLLSPHLPEKLAADEAQWLDRLEQAWETIAS